VAADIQNHWSSIWNLFLLCVVLVMWLLIFQVFMSVAMRWIYICLLLATIKLGKTSKINALFGWRLLQELNFVVSKEPNTRKPLKFHSWISLVFWIHRSLIYNYFLFMTKYINIYIYIYMSRSYEIIDFLSLYVNGNEVNFICLLYWLFSIIKLEFHY